METTLNVLRRQARLLQALLDQAERSCFEQDWRGAAEAMTAFAERLERRIALTETSVFPSIERRVQQIPFPAVTRVQHQHRVLAHHVGVAMAALSARWPAHAAAEVEELRSLLITHLEEEEQVLWPLIAAESPQELRPTSD